MRARMHACSMHVCMQVSEFWIKWTQRPTLFTPAQSNLTSKFAMFLGVT